jgi:type IV pilus assembly protein PilM
MANKQPGIWGIDVGQCALKAIRFERIDDVVTATAFDYIEYPKILSQPDTEDPDQLIREALEQFLTRNTIIGDLIAISVSGQSGLARFVKLPPVEPKKIPDIVRFEAKQQIPFSLDDVVWDWQVIGSSGETEGFVENEIGLFAIKKDMVYRALQAFKDVKVEVHVVQMAPLALTNFLTYDVLGKNRADEGGAGECVVAMDMGVDNTNLVVTDGGRIIWQRAIPIGGNHFTRALTRELKLTFAKAEHLKRNATKAEDPKKIFASMKPVFADFVGELQRSLSFFTNSHRNAQIKRMFGLGNAFRLTGLQKFVSQSMGVDVEKLESFKRLVGDEVRNSPVFVDNLLSFATAYGLALQGVDASKITTNLLPQDIRMERLVRSKKPWALTAAASLLVGVGAMAVFSGAQWNVAVETEKAATDAQSVLAESARHKEAFNKELQELITARKAATQILRGSEERVNWGLLYRYLNDNLPQPNGANLPRWRLANGDVPYNKYFADNPAARKAFEKKEERDRAGIRNESINASDLVQINIQSVWTRYCDSGMAMNFFSNVKDPKNITLRESLDEDWDKPLSNKSGWAVEVRGFTYHNGRHRFVIETFLENLRRNKKILWPLNVPHPKETTLDVSHFAILKHHTAVLEKDQAPGFMYLGQDDLYINSLVKGAGGSQAGSPGGSAFNPGGGGPMVGKLTEFGSGSEQMPSGGDSGGYASPRSEDWKGLASIASVAGDYQRTNSTGQGGVAPPIRPEDKHRTEFIIVFFWNEPLPTEPPPAPAVAPPPSGPGPGMLTK